MLKSTSAFEIAHLCVQDMRSRGWEFREGVERAAALAALPQINDQGVIKAIERALNEYRIDIDLRCCG